MGGDGQQNDGGDGQQNDGGEGDGNRIMMVAMVNKMMVAMKETVNRIMMVAMVKMNNKLIMRLSYERDWW